MDLALGAERRAPLVSEAKDEEAAILELSYGSGGLLGNEVEASEHEPKEARQDTVEELLARLTARSKFQRAARMARGKFAQHAAISLCVAGWTLMLCAPVYIWPIRDYLWSHECNGLAADVCQLKSGCRYNWVWSNRGCETTRNGYLSMWSSMVLQFLFCLGSNFGSNVKLTLTGFIGTFLAILNIAFLNWVLGFWMGGGAFTGAFTQVHHSGVNPANSGWLPLCTDGVHVLTPDGEHPFCFLNIWWAKMTLGGTSTAMFVYGNFILVVVLFLALGFDSNTRMFALSSHIYFMMAFVNPTSDSFETFPSIAWSYGVMIAIASVMAVLIFAFPKPRFTALASAEELAREGCEAACVLLETVHGCGISSLICQRASAAEEETRAVLRSLSEDLASAWFEDFGHGRRAERRRRLEHLHGLLCRRLTQLPSLQREAARLSEQDRALLEHRCSSLQELGVVASASLRSSLAAVTGWPSPSLADAEARLQEAQSRFAAEFAEVGSELSQDAAVFLFLASGLFSEVVQPAPEPEALPEVSRCQRCCDFFQDALKRLGFKWVDRSATHPRFVLRNTISICLAFSLGWVGLWNVMPAYSSGAASTISLIVYTYAGASAPLTIKRVSAVVLGNVIGAAIQLSFAVQQWFWATCYATSLFVIVTGCVFVYLHADKDISYIACLTGAYAVAASIPANAQFRASRSESVEGLTPSLFNTILCTVIGGCILIVSDLLMASKASRQARHHLLRALRRGHKLLETLAETQESDHDSRQQELAEDLSALSSVLPYASSEPSYWKLPFKADLYAALEQHLRRCDEHVRSIHWSVQLSAKDSSGVALYKGRLLTFLSAEAVDMLDHVLALASSVTHESVGADEDAAGVAEIRRLLAANLYSIQAARTITSGAAQAFTKVHSNSSWARRTGTLDLTHMSSHRKFPKRAEEDEISTQGGMSLSEVGSASCTSVTSQSSTKGWMMHKAHRIMHQVIHEKLEASADSSGLLSCHQQTATAEERGRALEQLVLDLRAQAARCPGSAPHVDESCRLEVVVTLGKALLAELQQMQLAILEY